MQAGLARRGVAAVPSTRRRPVRRVHTPFPDPDDARCVVVGVMRASCAPRRQNDTSRGDGLDRKVGQVKATDTSRGSGSTRWSAARRRGGAPDVAGRSLERRGHLDPDERPGNLDGGTEEGRGERQGEAEIAVLDRILTRSRMIVTGVAGLRGGLVPVIVVMMTVAATVMVIMMVVAEAGDQLDGGRRAMAGRTIATVVPVVGEPEVDRARERHGQHDHRAHDRPRRSAERPPATEVGRRATGRIWTAMIHAVRRLRAWTGSGRSIGARRHQSSPRPSTNSRSRVAVTTSERTAEKTGTGTERVR